MDKHPEPFSPVVRDDEEGHAREIVCLEAKIKSLSAQLESMADTSDMKEMLIIIRREGFTRPAEFMFINGVVDSIQGQANNLTAIRKVLLSGSQAVEIQPQPLPPGASSCAGLPSPSPVAVPGLPG